MPYTINLISLGLEVDDFYKGETEFSPTGNLTPNLVQGPQMTGEKTSQKEAAHKG